MLNLKSALLLLSTVLVMLLGLAPPEGLLEMLFTHGAYPLVFGLFISWVYRLLNLYGGHWRLGFKTHRVGCFLAGVLIMLIFIISPPKFKVLTEETDLIGVSMMMHENKTADMPTEGFYSDFTQPEFHAKVDNRPVFFPFLVSLLHSMIGYSPFNGFVLNFILGWAMLYLMYLSVSRVLTRTYGLLAMLMLASAPIFVVYVTASGFEVLNALFVVFAFYVLMETVDRRAGVRTTELLWLTLMLLAQCRYESVVFMPLFALFLLPLLRRQQFLRRMSFLTVLMPVFLLPVFWQRMIDLHLFDIDSNDYALVAKGHMPFSFQNLFHHLDDNIYVMLGIDPHWGFSIFLTGLAIAGAYLMSRHVLLGRQVPLEKAVYRAGATTFIALLVIISAYQLGKFTIPADNRLALVFLPYIVWMGVFCIYCLCRQMKITPARTLALMAVFHLLYFWPYGANQRVSNAMAIPYEYRHTLAYLNDAYRNRNGTLILTENPNMYLIHQFSAFSISSFDNMLKALPNETIERILALQRFNPQTGEIAAKSRIEGPIQTSTVQQIMVTSFSGIKISECYFRIGVDDMNESNVPPLRDREL